jgi:outer membrane protein assembly factor BamA
MSGEDFDKSLQLHPEDIASRKALLASLTPLDEAYRYKGYLDVAVNATPTLDKATHHVAFVISVDPGAQYHVRAINVLNLSPTQRKDFDSAWKLLPGEIFNAGYATDFLKNNTALQSLAGLSAAFKVTSDPEAHLADLTITFVHGRSSR